MNGQQLEAVDEERDLGVLVHKTLKPTQQCREAARRATGVLTQITRTFHYRDKRTFVNLYKQYVRPHVEYAVSARSPWTEQDKDLIEKVQKKFVNMISGLSGKTYKERLKELKLSSLATRRRKGDLVET